MPGPAGPPMEGPPPGAAMMAMPPMQPPSIPGFPPGIIPDMFYPGSPALQNAEMMIALRDPAVALSLIRLMLADVDTAPGPKYHAWYNKDDYPRPTVGDITNQAEQDRSDY